MRKLLKPDMEFHSLTDELGTSFTIWPNRVKRICRISSLQVSTGHIWKDLRTKLFLDLS